MMRYQARNSEFHLPPPDLRRLIENAGSPRNRLIIELFVYTGIRRAELRLLKREDLEMTRRRLIIRQGKGGKQRIVFLPETLMKPLAAFCSAHTSNFLFPGRAGGPMSLRNINYIVTRSAQRALVATPNPRYVNVGPHLLRHSFARNWKRAGGSLESLQKLLGHQSLKTTLDIYGTESQDEVEENYHAMVNSLVAHTTISHS